MRPQFLLIWAAVLGLAACAGRPPARPVVALKVSQAAIKPALPAPTVPSPITPTVQAESSANEVTPTAFAALPGWAGDDHAAALRAFQASCPAQRAAAMVGVCQRALMLIQPDEVQSRRFFEANFVPEPPHQSGLLTGYFTPIYEARAAPEGEFTAPVRPPPADSHYSDRAVIERRSPADAVAWMRPEDLFFLQIQGSGVLVFADGARMKAVFDGANGAPFSGIAAPLRQKGLLADDNTSAAAIHDWLARNRGPEAEAMMDLDRRYVFFRLQPDDGLTPSGAAGARLTPGRAVAVDPTLHAMGEVLWIDAEAPALTGAFPVYRRLAVALDTGNAIKGESRADLYLGEGPDAGLEAGRVRHTLRLYRLEPIVASAR